MHKRVELDIRGRVSSPTRTLVSLFGGGSMAAIRSGKSGALLLVDWQSFCASGRVEPQGLVPCSANRAGTWRRMLGCGRFWTDLALCFHAVR